MKNKNCIYISSPFFDETQLKKVKFVEEALKENPTVDKIISPRLNQDNQDKMFSPMWCKHMYNLDLKELNQCNITLEILDYDNQDTDSGTAFEMGYAKSHHKFCTAIRFDDSPINLMLGEATDYHFKNLKELKHYNFNTKKTNHWNISMH